MAGRERALEAFREEFAKAPMSRVHMLEETARWRMSGGLPRVSRPRTAPHGGGVCAWRPITGGLLRTNIAWSPPEVGTPVVARKPDMWRQTQSAAPSEKRGEESELEGIDEPATLRSFFSARPVSSSMPPPSSDDPVEDAMSDAQAAEACFIVEPTVEPAPLPLRPRPADVRAAPKTDLDTSSTADGLALDDGTVSRAQPYDVLSLAVRPSTIRRNSLNRQKSSYRPDSVLKHRLDNYVQSWRGGIMEFVSAWTDDDKTCPEARILASKATARAKKLYVDLALKRTEVKALQTFDVDVLLQNIKCIDGGTLVGILRRNSAAFGTDYHARHDLFISNLYNTVRLFIEKGIKGGNMLTYVWPIIGYVLRHRKPSKGCVYIDGAMINVKSEVPMFVEFDVEAHTLQHREVASDPLYSLQLINGAYHVLTGGGVEVLKGHVAIGTVAGELKQAMRG